MKNNFGDYPLLISKNKSVNLFYPHIPKNAKKAVSKVLSGRWLGQGPLVDKFEKIFSKKFCSSLPVVAVGAGTDALHLSYILSDIKKMMKLFVQFLHVQQPTFHFCILEPRLNLQI